jgi:hypothetical protein
MQQRVLGTHEEHMRRCNNGCELRALTRVLPHPTIPSPTDSSSRAAGTDARLEEEDEEDEEEEVWGGFFLGLVFVLGKGRLLARFFSCRSAAEAPGVSLAPFSAHCRLGFGVTV